MLLKGKNINILKITVFLGLLFFPFFAYSQKDTIQSYPEIRVKGRHVKIEKYTALSLEQIDALAPDDLGSLLQYITGITIKDYGGIGGIKTLSNRGLGGQHTQLIVDGFPINDVQNGQINFAAIQPNNIEEIKVSHQAENEPLPVSALIKGSDIQIKTFDQQFSSHLLSVRSTITVGSFGQKEVAAGIKKGGQNNFISFSGGTKTYEGDYPYRLYSGENEENQVRKNNTLNDYHLSLGGGFKWRKESTKHVIKLNANTHQIDQKLPGAVILYNDLSRETLKTWNTGVGANYQLTAKNMHLIIFTNYAHRHLHYHDPNYLNMAGFLDNKYSLHSVVGGFNYRYTWKDLIIQVGNDFGADQLNSNRELGSPQRYTNTSMLKARYNWSYFYVEASAFSQLIVDQNNMQNHRNNYVKVHPQLAVFTSDRLFKNWQFFVWYKPSSRAASFNELYFSQTGNKDLIPEESAQLDLGLRFAKTIKRFDFQIQGNVFRNRVDHKIIALPTKNLFIWSIQNIGKVDIYGGDLNLIGALGFGNDWKFHFQGGMSYQKAIDISDQESPTYKHQIAYTPKLTGNATLSGSYKQAGLNLSMLYIGKRYSLNENISSNQLDPYFILNLSASYAYNIKGQHTLKLHAGVKNITNQSYNFVRYFVMPGINYFIKLSYDFN